MVQALYEATAARRSSPPTSARPHVDAAAHQFHAPAALDQLRRPGDDGFGLPAAMGAEGRAPRGDRRLHRRGRLGADRRAGAARRAPRRASPVKVFIMNNGYLGIVRQWQELFWDRRYSQVDMGRFPDFVKLAEAYGATGPALPPTSGRSWRTCARALGHRGPGPGRRPRDARGERVPDDRARGRRPRHGGLGGTVGEPGTKELLSLEELEASGALRTGRKHTLSILVENKPGVLTRISGLFARRGFNIDTLVGRADRQRALLPRHADPRRRAAPDRPGHQAAPQARQRPEDPRPEPSGHRRARARDVQGRRRGRPPRRSCCRPPRSSAARSSTWARRSVIIELTGPDRQDRGLREARAALRPHRDDADGGDHGLPRPLGDLSVFFRPHSGRCITCRPTWPRSGGRRPPARCRRS